MKNTKKIKKLELNKTTLRNLTAGELLQVAGGYGTGAGNSAICHQVSNLCYGTGIG
jgi:hypothetical protein